ncbi:MAG: hypothetical protein Q8N96_06790 [Methylovulum sp.]|nr:hypothetical protein [Methylovulum sp.]
MRLKVRFNIEPDNYRSHAPRGNAVLDAPASHVVTLERDWLRSHAERGNDKTVGSEDPAWERAEYP